MQALAVGPKMPISSTGRLTRRPYLRFALTTVNFSVFAFDTLPAPSRATMLAR
jgi:hypothetical protein